MTKRRHLYLIVVGLLLVLLLLVFCTNLYFINWLIVDDVNSSGRKAGNQRPGLAVPSSVGITTVTGKFNVEVRNRGLVEGNDEQDGHLPVQFPSRSDAVRALVEAKAGGLKPIFRNKNPRFYPVKRALLKAFEAKSYNISTVWKLAGAWPQANEIYPAKDDRIGKVIKALQESEITRARNTPRGTQLKLLLDLSGKQSVLFKPAWYDKNVTIEGPVYAGKDRHIAEIVAFHLGAILNLRWTPIVVGRKISLAKLLSVADDGLRETMMKNGTRQCVYGKCYYCKESEAVCDDSATGSLEGTVLLIVPGKFIKYRSPWQRTYRDGLSAEWERAAGGYCAKVREQLPLERMLDLIDVAIFDFLIQNGDRHHYETRDDRVLLMDNGKGFGNAFKDHYDILAPLYQCCLLRKTTWERLQLFSGGALTETLQSLSSTDLLHPLLTKDHLKALERRLLLLYATVELCKEKYGNKIFK